MESATMSRRGGRRRLAVAIVAISMGLLGAGASPAQADDASVLAAVESHDAAFTVVGRQVAVASQTLARTHRGGPLLGALARTRALIIATRKAVLGQQASTPTGAAARSASIRTLSYFENSIISLYRGTRAAITGHRVTALALSRRAEAQAKLAQAAGDQAVTLFRQAGLSPHTTSP